MDELPGGLIERDQALVLIENIDRKRLGEKSLGRFFDFTVISCPGRTRASVWTGTPSR